MSDPDCVNTKRSEAIGTAMVAVRYIAEVAGSRLDISSLNARWAEKGGRRRAEEPAGRAAAGPPRSRGAARQLPAVR